MTDSLPPEVWIEVTPASALPAAVTELLFDWFRAEWGLEPDQTARADWRIFALAGDEIVGHAGIVERTVSIGGAPYPVGGIAAVYVIPAWRGRGLGTALMRQVEDVLHDETTAGFGHLICEPEGVSFYAGLGWQEVPGPMVFTAWDGQRLTVGHRIMVLPLRGEPWPPGPIDANGLLW